MPTAELPAIGRSTGTAVVFTLMLLGRMLELSLEAEKTWGGLIWANMSLLSGLVVAWLLLHALWAAHPTRSAGARRLFNVGRASLIGLAMVITVLGPTIAIMYIRARDIGPIHRQSNDVVLADEAAIQHLLAGRNPYSASYDTGRFAEWSGTKPGDDWYHYAYGPWGPLFGSLFCAASRAMFSWYDNRLVYLIAYAMAICFTLWLVTDLEDRLLLLSVVALLPVTSTGLIAGFNDYFVLAWIMGSVFFLQRGRPWVAAIFLGLAIASKLTAVFMLIPFAVHCVAQARPFRLHRRALALAVLPLIVAFLVYLPFIISNPAAVWRAQVSGIAQRATATTVNPELRVTQQTWGVAGLTNFIESRRPSFPRLPNGPLVGLVGCLMSIVWGIVIWQQPRPASILLAGGTTGLATLYFSVGLLKHYFVFYLLLVIVSLMVQDAHRAAEKARPAPGDVSVANGQKLPLGEANTLKS